jgi:MFS superfamily sulfate permease-like transporter
MTKKNSLFSFAKQDLMAGLIVFLIALPLCLGIAQASNAPLFSGLVAGIIGGVVVGFLSKSNVSVSGPAAGLVAIVIGALEQLSAFEIFLCAVMVAGAIQLVLGLIRAGGIANYFPSNVIEGMLAGIGMTIIIKQIPDAVGYRNPGHTGMDDADDGFALGGILDSVNHVELGAIVIALIGLVILTLWTTKRIKVAQLLPAGLMVVVVGVLLNEVFQRISPGLHVDGSQLVNLPVPDSASAFFSQFKLPDFKGFMNPAVWQVGLVIAVVASIETLLCIEASDKLDTHKRYTSGDAELRAQGIGNLVSGLVGGLPITSVIVRSSANINAGAQTKLSAMIHGVLLLVCVALIPALLNSIPKSALAAVLIFTGYRLCRPEVFKHMWHAGLSQFLPFLVTAIAVVSLDLLKGVGLGMAFSIFYILRNNLDIPFYFHAATYKAGKLLRLDLAQEVSFLNKPSIKKTLDMIPAGTSVVLNAKDTEYIDYDVLEVIREFQETKAPEKNIRVLLIGFKDNYPIHGDHVDDHDIFAGEEPTDVSTGKHSALIKHLGNNQ